MTSYGIEGSIDYLDVVEVLVENFYVIKSIEDVYSLLSENNIKDITTPDDIKYAEQYGPVPTKSYLFSIKNMAGNKGEVEIFFLCSGELVNIRVQIFFQDIVTGNEDSYRFMSEELIPFIENLFQQSIAIYNPPIYNPETGDMKIEGMLIRYGGIAVVVHKLTGAASISTWITLEKYA